MTTFILQSRLSPVLNLSPELVQLVLQGLDISQQGSGQGDVAFSACLRPRLLSLNVLSTTWGPSVLVCLCWANGVLGPSWVNDKVLEKRAECCNPRSASVSVAGGVRQRRPA